MRTAINVQHLPGYVASFGQINHSIGDILRFGDRAHRRKGRQEVFRDSFDKRGVDSPGRNRVEADVERRHKPQRGLDSRTKRVSVERFSEGDEPAEQQQAGQAVVMNPRRGSDLDTRTSVTSSST